MQITILARRWFERRNGNTYHSCRVFINGQEIGYTPFHYGYDEQYMQTAFDLIQKWAKGPENKNRAPGVTPHNTEFLRANGLTVQSMDYHGFRLYQRGNRERFVVDCVDVIRKRDL